MQKSFVFKNWKGSHPETMGQISMQPAQGLHMQELSDKCLVLAGRSTLRVFSGKTACQISETFPTNGLSLLKGGSF